MYEELVKRLRSQCQGYGKECEDCNADGNCRSQMENEAADAIDELTRENESLAKSVNEASKILRRRWIPVTERLPEENGRYLVRYVRDIDLEGGVHSDEVRTMRFVDAQWRFPFICNPDVRELVTMEKVTHWMPLPEPPKEET